MDNDNHILVNELIQWLAKIDKIPAEQLLIEHCYDSSGYSTGTAASWANCTMGISASVIEYMGGIFGYDFDAAQMTRSLRIRANLMLSAYRHNTKEYIITETADTKYFHWDMCPSMTRHNLRYDGTGGDTGSHIVTYEDIYGRWDKLAHDFPSYIKKSAKLGISNEGNDVYSYTIGSGAEKILFIGGNLRWGCKNKITEFGVYMLAEILCNDYLVNQSRLLANLKNKYTIVVLPSIDINVGANNVKDKYSGLNCMALSSVKWQITQGKCTPTTFATNTAKDIPILIDFLTQHSDAKCILSGGEDTSQYKFENPKYSTDYMTQVIYPLNQSMNPKITAYLDHLHTDRGETVAVVEKTDGKTFGDYAFDNLGIPTYYINQKVSQKWEERKHLAQPGERTSDGGGYLYRNYETGRRVANIVNFILAYGG